MTGRGSVRDASQEILLGPPAPFTGAPRRCVQEYVPPYYAVALRALRRRKLRGTHPPSAMLGWRPQHPSLDAVGSMGPGQKDAGCRCGAVPLPLPLRCQSVWARSRAGPLVLQSWRSWHDAHPIGAPDAPSPDTPLSETNLLRLLGGPPSGGATPWFGLSCPRLHASMIVARVPGHNLLRVVGRAA